MAARGGPVVIRLLFFARLREQLGCAELEIDWQLELATGAALRQCLRAQHPQWDESLGADSRRP